MIQDLQSTTFQIGQLAAEVGINPKTIRFYEAVGLLPTPNRNEVGYRIYTHADRERLHFIAKAKTLGLTLEEIREILLLKHNGVQPCQQVRSLLDRKLATVEEQLRILADLRQELLTLREKAAETMTAEATVCGIIEQHRRRQ